MSRQDDRFPARLIFGLAGITLVFAIVANFGTRAGAQAPPAPPIPGLATSPPTSAPGAPTNPVSPSPLVIPSATPSPTPRGRHRAPAAASPGPSGSPTSPAFATLDGTWEVQLQYIDHTDYSYFVIHQTENGTLSGLWRVNGKEYPFAGTYDGHTFQLLVKEPAGNVTMAGYVEGASDIVGTVDRGDKSDKTPFTAEHRQSIKGPLLKGRSY